MQRLHGNVLFTNDNFLSIMGYTMGELEGRHHRVFCEKNFAKSEAYASFWEKLKRGEFHAGEFKHVTKSGKEVWI